MIARIIAVVLAAICFATPATAAKKKNDAWAQSSKSWKKNYYKKKYRKKYGKKYSKKYRKKYGKKYSKKKKYNKKFPPGAAKWSGGPKPFLSGKSPGTVRFRGKYKVGSIVIDSRRRKLYYVLPGKRAYRYPIAVGKAGFGWTGVKRITRKAKWPGWTPPKEMRRRKPNLPKHMTGGLYNPLGARALYLGSSLYRIHGTYNTASIGTASSSGCFRMHNQHVVHLSKIAGIGTTVYVRRSLPKYVASK
ncbi:MAG: L,D-transpeptidase [Hyphomicrobiaceae bacterium]